MNAKTLMIQGTGSGVGKSVITAAFCRWFHLEGWRVAPFKAQNMSLNSFVTADGGEMGRAQVYQAEACGIAPHVAMNPVLLKPCGDNLSQVIVMGNVAATYNAKDYYAGKPRFIEDVQKAFDYLKNEYEMVILEGAGSPAEINLKKQDFVNMAMAEMADAPVLIVGDIDRGGVFAWMKGTYDLLTPQEQDRVKGFLINKFRGDLDLLRPGVEQFEAMVQKPVLGVIPFDRELYVDEEDAIPTWDPGKRAPGQGLVDIAIIRLPRISNFTDFAPLVLEPGCSVRYVWHPDQMGDPDLIIIPGTKNTLDDMQFLKDQELDRSILHCHGEGTLLLGVCGGFQMLGKTLSDPDHIESDCGEISGLGLMDSNSTLLGKKITRQVKSSTVSSPIFGEGLTAEGYEIHMGVTTFQENHLPLFKSENGGSSLDLGSCNKEGTLVGTYLHGFFDRDELRHAFLNFVRTRRGLPVPDKRLDYQKVRNEQLNRLARLIGESVDMKQVEKIMGLEKTSSLQDRQD